MAKCSRCGAAGIGVKLDDKGRCIPCLVGIERELRAKIDSQQRQIEALTAFHDKYVVVQDARAEAQSTLASANAKAEEITSSSAQQADTLLSEAKSKAEQILTSARFEADKATKNALSEAAIIRIEAKRDMDRLLSNANTDCDEIMHRATAYRNYTEEYCRTLSDQADAQFDRARAESRLVFALCNAMYARARTDCDNALEQTNLSLKEMLHSAARKLSLAAKTPFRYGDLVLSEQQAEQTKPPERPYTVDLSDKTADVQTDKKASVQFTEMKAPTFLKTAEKNGFIALDFETTGLYSNARDRIVEIGAAYFMDGELIRKFSTLVNPQRHIPERATKVNHITDLMVADKPAISEVLPDLLAFISDTPVVAHNASFDMGFFRSALENCQMSARIRYADSLKMVRAAYPESENHKLATVADYLGVSAPSTLHRAEADCIVLGKIILRIMEDKAN